MPGPQQSFSERAYRKLLLLYPTGLRKQYGEPMAQVFRDQYRRAQEVNGNAGLIALWFQTIWDLACSFPGEQNDELRKNMNIGLKLEKLTVGRFFGMAFLAMMICFGVKTGMEPRAYRVSELLLVENNSARADTFIQAGRISTELKRVGNLDEVIQRLDLQKRFNDSKLIRTPVSKLEARYLLNSMVAVQPELNISVPGMLRRTSQAPNRENAVIHLTVTYKDREMARQIAACFGELLVEKFRSESSSIQDSPGAPPSLVGMNPQIKVLILEASYPEKTHPIAYLLARTITLGGMRSLGIGLALGLVFWCGQRMSSSRQT
ncbi:MAG: hypothetical protein JWM04_533 [Verrucomicrobiales bacterium]|nr:hypothetical protein [Verrucomicrobiales bacterium]